MLELSDLCFEYSDKLLWRGLNLSLSAGDLLHLKGANGAGKTTLLKVIGGLYRPSQGKILFDGRLIDDDLQAYHSQLCFVGHRSGLNPYLTARENCTFDLHYQELDGLSSIFNLEAVWDSPCALLSAGQKRQVSLLRLWTTRARLWLLDEPLVALDERALGVFTNRLNAHRAEGGIIVLTSHQSLPDTIGRYEVYQL